ncbi:hypothetical protein JQC92_14080 [Shewanella sp. 202IG2-18]|uniref:hypothetical protein n=1 Tax=Parashewanella hymeniacidonis TaxID=2807618 RepID=UPI0019605714|nr:hypothetical protein [Parashewanella hymeniacidonis]MBM7073141.1 hypothetical protein [Parashewanella hymeniacidonis]
MATGRVPFEHSMHSMQQMSFHSQPDGASRSHEGAHRQTQTELLRSTAFTGSGMYPTSSSVPAASQSTTSLAEPSSMPPLPDCFDCRIPLAGYEPVCKPILPFDPHIEENYGILNDLWTEPKVTEDEFRKAYENARDLHLVPFDAKDILDERTYNKANLSDSCSAAPFKFSVQAKLYLLTKSLNLNKPNRSQNITEALLCLHYLAHVETGEGSKLWEDALEDLNNQTTIFRTGGLNYYDVLSDLKEINRKQVEISSQINPRQMICGSGQIDFCQSSRERDDFLISCDTSSSLMTSLQHSVQSSVPRTSVKLIAPEMNMQTRLCLDTEGGALQDYTYKFDPSIRSAPSYPLFSDSFKATGFASNVEKVLAEKNYSEEYGRDLFQLHMACKVLQRDIPARQDFKELNINVHGDVSTVESIKSSTKLLKELLPGASTEKFIGLLHTQLYLKELIPVLECKAKELGICLYCFDLPEVI